MSAPKLLPMGPWASHPTCELWRLGGSRGLGGFNPGRGGSDSISPSSDLEFGRAAVGCVRYVPRLPGFVVPTDWGPH